MLAPKVYHGRAWNRDYGRHVLDFTRLEIEKGTPDDPYGQFRKSELFRVLNALIDAAMARAGLFNSDDEDALEELRVKAKLTPFEFEAIALRAAGWKWLEIAKTQKVSQGAARQSGHRAAVKLRQFRDSPF